MGKKQHQKDKMYLTSTEWKNEFGGHKDTAAARLLKAKYRRLPFTHCALSLQDFDTPMCTDDGMVFDIVQIIPFIKKYGVHPVKGTKLTVKDLIKLNYVKNSDGEYHCPVTYKVFTPNSHIVAVKPSGNVYSYEAIEQLNIKAKHWFDLMDNVPFKKSDIITLQDPNDIANFNIDNFHHVKFNLRADAEIEEERRAMLDPAYTLRKMNTETRETLKQLATDYVPSTSNTGTALPIADGVNAAPYSVGQVSAAFTSTVMPAITQQLAAVIDEDVLIQERVKKNGYVRIVTSLGPLNLELYCPQTPLACKNFIKHCQDGYYNKTVFHRLIKNFMIQGGDPTGKGKGGESIYAEGKPFKDEFVKGLSHTGRGVLCMANSGADTNKSQFYITFRSCKHLDNKHTVFGRLVGGLDTLELIENVKVDEKDRPIEKITFVSAEVFVDPFAEAVEQLAKERQALKDKDASDKAATVASKNDKDTPAIKPTYRAGVGKYINTKAVKTAPKAVVEAVEDDTPPEEPKKKRFKNTLDDFSSW